MRKYLSCVAVAGLLLPAGCGQQNAPVPQGPTKAVVQQPTATKAGPTPNAAQGSIRRSITRQGVPQELRQLVLIYLDYNTTFGRSPRRLEDLQATMPREAPKLWQALQESYYVVVWGINSPSSNVMIAYEKEADQHGIRWTAMGDGSTVKMNQQEFDAALKAR